MLARWFALFALLMISMPAFAGGIAVVDFQRAVAETEEGKAAKARFDAMFKERQSALEQQAAKWQQDVQDYQAKALILSDEVRQATERDLGKREQQIMSLQMQYEQEMQQAFMTVFGDIDTKMRTMTETIAKEKGYDVVLDGSFVVYHGGNAVDMTSELIKRYNSGAK